MKRRRGVTVFGALLAAFVVLACAAYAVTLFVQNDFTAKFDFLTVNQNIVNVFTNFNLDNLVPTVTVVSIAGMFVLVALIWLIVDLVRGRKIVFFFLLLFLLTSYTNILYNFVVIGGAEDVTAAIEAFTASIEKNTMNVIPVAGYALADLAWVLAIVLFIVDLATGRVVKEPAPKFIQEPTEEVSEGHFEEVKDESEVEQPAQEEKPAEPAPVVAAEEAKQEEVEQPQEEEKAEEEAPAEEEKPAPAKKPAAPKKVKKEPAKKAPAKKPEAKKAAEPKKEEKKPAPAKKPEPKKAEPKKEAPKAEPKKAEPKKEAPKAEEARKTQTITLQNEEGKTYAKAYHVSRRADLNKWQVKATGSDKALKLFNTQKEAIEYAKQLSKNQNVSVRVHSKEGKIRKHQ